MRSLLALLALIVVLLPLGGCSCGANPTEPVAVFRNPFAIRHDPIIEPDGFAVRQRVEQVRTVRLVPEAAPAAAPAPAACAPAYTPGFTYAAPPTPGACAPR